MNWIVQGECDGDKNRRECVWFLCCSFNLATIVIVLQMDFMYFMCFTCTLNVYKTIVGWILSSPLSVSIYCPVCWWFILKICLMQPIIAYHIYIWSYLSPLEHIFHSVSPVKTFRWIDSSSDSPYIMFIITLEHFHPYCFHRICSLHFIHMIISCFDLCFDEMSQINVDSIALVLLSVYGGALSCMWKNGNGRVERSKEIWCRIANTQTEQVRWRVCRVCVCVCWQWRILLLSFAKL